MWILKARIFHKDSKGIELAKKFKIEIWVIPVSVYKKKGKVLISLWHQLFGHEKNIEAFIKHIKKDKSIFDLEIQGNTVYYSYVVSEKGSHYAVYANPAIIFVKPVIVYSDGKEVVEIGCFSKKTLMNAIALMKKTIEITVLKISKEKAPTIFIPHTIPALSKMQKKCLELAYIKQYYKVPRKITLEEIAKEAGISYSTFQEHLRKAEEKVMPYFLETYAEYKPVNAGIKKKN